MASERDAQSGEILVEAIELERLDPGQAGEGPGPWSLGPGQAGEDKDCMQRISPDSPLLIARPPLAAPSRSALDSVCLCVDLPNTTEISLQFARYISLNSSWVTLTSEASVVTGSE